MILTQIWHAETCFLFSKDNISILKQQYFCFKTTIYFCLKTTYFCLKTKYFCLKTIYFCLKTTIFLLYRDCIFSIETTQCLCVEHTQSRGGRAGRAGRFAGNSNPTLGVPSPPHTHPKLLSRSCGETMLLPGWHHLSIIWVPSCIHLGPILVTS